jgi:hypothetical protein
MKQTASNSRALESIVAGFPALTQPAPHGPAQGRIGERFRRLLEINSARMRIAQIEVMIADLDGSARELEAVIQAEQDKTGIHDPAHFAYSTCAKAMSQRRDNLNRSIDKLKRQLADAKLALE